MNYMKQIANILGEELQESAIFFDMSKAEIEERRKLINKYI